MEFVTEIDFNEYEKFVQNNEYKSHFLQSSLWGEFCKLEKNLIPHYVGIKENDNLICAALLLEKKIGFGHSYFYAPRGYVINFEDEKLLKIFTLKLKKYIKKRKGIFLKIDPDIIIKKYNYKEEEIKVENTTYDNLIKLGYKHLGFTTGFKSSQPRFTFRIDFNKPFEEIEENFSKTTKQRIKKASDLDVEVKIDNNIEEFYKLMTITENKKGFITHNKSYYENLYNIFKNNSNIFLGSINIDKMLNINYNIILDLNTEIKNIKEQDNLSRSMKIKLNELEIRKDKLELDNKEYINIKNTKGNNIILSAHFIINYGNKAWVLYAGNNDILTNTYANYKTYYEHIKYYYDKGIEIYDQFGTVGKLEPNDPLLGIHEFKKKFGGDYIEFIGEFDLVTNKLLYFIFNKCIPIYRNIKFKKNSKKLHK